MKREYTVIIEQDEAGYYVAEVPELYGCHTQAKSLDELMVRIKEAIELCREVDKEKKQPRKHLVGVQKIAV
jgi:predicted RNase H-like HicB family nuclease